jgi:branched-chain amino acid transport system ATP-binding protein
MAELLKLENLSAGYGEAVVLNDISFSLGEGETLALLGRNGTGKTTLMDTLAGAWHQPKALAGCRKSATFSNRSRCTKT